MKEERRNCRRKSNMPPSRTVIQSCRKHGKGRHTIQKHRDSEPEKRHEDTNESTGIHVSKARWITIIKYTVLRSNVRYSANPNHHHPGVPHSSQYSAKYQDTLDAMSGIFARRREPLLVLTHSKFVISTESEAEVEKPALRF